MRQRRRFPSVSTRAPQASPLHRAVGYASRAAHRGGGGAVERAPAMLPVACIARAHHTSLGRRVLQNTCVQAAQDKNMHGGMEQD